MRSFSGSQTQRATSAAPNASSVEVASHIQRSLGIAKGRNAPPNGARHAARPDSRPNPRALKVYRRLQPRRFSDRHAFVRAVRPLEGRDQTEQDMISPDAVNFQISLGEAFLLEAGPPQQ